MQLGVQETVKCESTHGQGRGFGASAEVWVSIVENRCSQVDGN